MHQTSEDTYKGRNARKKIQKFFFLKDFFFIPTDRPDFSIGLRPETNYFLRSPLSIFSSLGTLWEVGVAGEGMGVRGGHSVVIFHIYLFFCVSKAFASVLVIFTSPRYIELSHTFCCLTLLPLGFLKVFDNNATIRGICSKRRVFKDQKWILKHLYILSEMEG